MVATRSALQVVFMCRGGNEKVVGWGVGGLGVGLSGWLARYVEWVGEEKGAECVHG